MTTDDGPGTATAATSRRRVGSGAVAGVGLLAAVSSTVFHGIGAPAAASPAADCLNPTSEPRIGLEGCVWAERQLRLTGRGGTQRSSPLANPAFPPELRASKRPEADVHLARARHLARLGERDQARSALEQALRTNASVAGADEVRRLIEAGDTRAEPEAPR